jgi:ribonuclease HII
MHRDTHGDMHRPTDTGHPLLQARHLPSLRRERALQRAGYQFIAGIDEAGRGAWAGPVVAAAVILPFTAQCVNALRGVNDSKQLTAHQREGYRTCIEATALAYAVGQATHAEIDLYGIVPATRLAMMRAVQGLPIQADALLIDAVRLPELTIRQEAFNFADSISLSVAAASILAKTARDALMCQLDESFPGYGFAVHKGYGTAAHQAALAQLGISPVHRRSYAPIRRLIADLPE